jgi:hypothetical protein
MANIKVSYLYRDASNYKRFASVILDNPSNISLEAFETAFSKAVAKHNLFSDIVHFRPEDFGWETAYFEDHDPETAEDFNLHELDEVEFTSEPVNAAGWPLR